MRTCKKCGNTKPISDFYDKFHQCKVCILAMRKEKSDNDPLYREKARQRAAAWAKANPERAKRNGRRTYLKYKFNISLEEYEELLRTQGHECAACGATDSGIANRPVLMVDHDHVTGEIRGLLCNGCNAALGMVNDDVDRLRRLIAYLARTATATIPA